MVSNATIIACVISLIVSTVLPIVLIAVYARRNRSQKLFRPWLMGAAGFLVTQILIRVPILTVLQTQGWFISFSENHLFGFSFLLAFTAGLFELTGRFAVAKLMQKDLNYKRSLAAGLGHGGIEAMVLIGMSYINNLLYIYMINSGSFDALIAQTAAAGVDVSQLHMIRDALISTSPALFLLGGFERVLAMTAHVGMTMIVSFGIWQKNPLQGALLCLAIHTLIDLTAGINMLVGTMLTQSTAYVLMYALLVIAAAASVWIVSKIHRRWTEKEVSL